MGLNKFLIDTSLAYDVINLALSTGGDFAELFLEQKVCNSLVMINGKVDKIVSGIDYGLGLRIFNGYGAIYSYTNDTSKDSLLKLAKESALAINKKDKINKVLDFINYKIENIHNIKKSYNEVYKKDIIDLLKEANDVSFNYDKNITQTNNGCLNEVQDVLIINSEGLWAEDTRVRTRIFISSVASDLNEKQTGGFFPGAHKGMEFLEDIDIKCLAKKSAEKAIIMLKADLCPKGKMPVIVDKGFGAVLLHESCGHSLEATSVAKNASEFADKKGCKIASSIVTIVDDPTIKNAWGSQNIDDEGTKTKKNVLVEKGILKSFLVDKLNGLKMNEISTGSGRRQSYKFAPTSRMSNTYIESGKDKEKDIISDTEYGLYAKTMGGGSVQPVTGEFNFAVTEAYLIKSGKITEPVRGATLIGKGSEVLMNIDKVACDLEHGQGMCGSISGSIPVNCGQPMIRVSELIVGGRK